jgi:hypothetical protein
LEDGIEVPTYWTEMRPVAAKRIGGKITVAVPAIEMRDVAPVAADREVGSSLFAAAIRTVKAINVHASLEPKEGVVVSRAARATEYTPAVELLPV